ncbi:hypothetical protein QQ045_010137 [Rhodiola kirilowii]
MDAEEYRSEALEFYNKSSNEVKAQAKNFFNLMDSDGDSTIDVEEFAACVKGIKFITNEGYLFEGLDRNGDGSLDFNEFITFFYAIFSACVCDGCGKRFMGQDQLTCGTCFATASDTFDLCSECFSSKNFAHQHNNFLDFKALVFGSIASQVVDKESSDEDDARDAPTTPKVKRATTYPCAHGYSKNEKGARSSRKRDKAKKVLEGVQTTLEIIDVVNKCRTM